MNSHRHKVLFVLFFISGFCGLLYQMIWIRLAFASFGIITPVLSVVISVFMLGLSLGSWAGGKLISPLTRKTKVSAILFYALAEFFIGLGAFAVPRLFSLGATWLLGTGETDSFSYLFFSALVIMASIFPWCVFMGVTFPFVMAFVKEYDQSNTGSFSFLYLANVIGAMFGTLVTALILIELLGFHQTLLVAACSNFLIAIISVGLGLSIPRLDFAQEKAEELPATFQTVTNTASIMALLFTTGFTSMGMEVVWTRNFTPVIGTQVYAFAGLLFIYLLATWIGSYLYRFDLKRNRVQPLAASVAVLSVCALLPVVVNDPRFIPQILIGSIYLPLPLVFISIFPFCAILGYVTPRLIDDCSAGNPAVAGRAYALNILGCILGPLFASYTLLPFVGAQFSLVVLAVPFVFFFGIHLKTLRPNWRIVTGLTLAACLICALFINRSYEDPFSEKHVVRRDHTATVICYGNSGEDPPKTLLVNGVGITNLTPITKFMAHLPLAAHKEKAESALVICFGMGTTYRSLMSWNLQVTAVELVPSVKESFGYFFNDAPTILQNPKGRIVIDDGRRFLKRTIQSFDVITIDPPPPAEAAGSSLLYSEEFYELVKQRLKPHGILQQWYAFGEERTINAVARSLANSFPYIKVYRSIEGWGYHFLASNSPIETANVEEMIARMPESAQKDLVEWSGDPNLAQDLRNHFNIVFRKEIPMTMLLNQPPNVRITDDHPFNEYFLLRATKLNPWVH